MPRRLIGLFAAILFATTVVAANWLVVHVGIVSVGFGLLAPAGVYAVGIAFILRDVTQRALGRLAAAVAILAGAAISYQVAPSLAYASAVAFLISEFADLATFSLIERDHVPTAVVMSNIVGAAVDSIVFLQIAFGSIAFFPGQFVGKLWMTLLFLPVFLGVRRLFPKEVLV